MAMKWRFLAVGAALTAAIGLFASCGADDDKDDDNDSTGETIAFSTVEPILSGSCGSGDGSCHASGANNITLQTEAGLKADAANVKTRIGLPAGNSLKMPAAGGAKNYTLSEADEATLIKFVDQ